MMTAVRQTATVQPNGHLDLAVPEVPPGTVTEVIVLVSESLEPMARTTNPPAEPSPTERLAEIQRLRAKVTLTAEQAAHWIEEIRLERQAWRLPGDESNP
jgi:hypothetical protein